MECIVCYENITKTTPITECGHKIHHKCLLKWKFICNYNHVRLTCPYCTQPIDNMRKTRSEYRNDIKILRELTSKFNTIDNLDEEYTIRHKEYMRMRIIIKIFKIFNSNKSLIYKDKNLVKVTREKVCFLKKELKESDNDFNKTLRRKLNNVLDETNRLFKIYTTS